MDNIKEFSLLISVTNLCNFMCKYCITIENKIHQHKIYFISLDIIKHIIYCSNTFLSDFDIIIKLMGGEPLLLKNLNNIIDKLYQIKRLKRITIFTNNTLPLNNILVDKKIKYTISYHNDELHKHNELFNQYINNIEYLNNNNIDYTMNVMIKDYNDTESMGNYYKLKNIMTNNQNLNMVYVANTKFYKNDNMVEQQNRYNNKYVYPKRSLSIYKNIGTWNMIYSCEMFPDNSMNLYNIKKWNDIKKDADTYIRCNKDFCVCYSCEF